MRYETEHGAIGISTGAIAAVAGSVAQKCFGALAPGKTNPLAALMGREAQPGVQIETLEDGAVALDIHMAVSYGVNIPAVCRAMRDEIRYHVQELTGVTVRAVNLYVDNLRP